jgi:hypothetical protein
LGFLRFLLEEEAAAARSFAQLGVRHFTAVMSPSLMALL